MKEHAATRIRELYAEHGEITPDMVIEDARDPDSPLHELFEWDVEKAAMDAWRETARELIRSVKIQITVESKSFNATGYHAPEFVRNPSVRSDHQGYIRVHEIRTNRELSQEALFYELDRINSSLTRARALCTELGLDNEFEIVTNALRIFKEKAAG